MTTHNDTTAPIADQGPKTLPRLRTVQSIVDETGIPLSSFRREVAEGHGPQPLKIGGRTYFFQRDVETWLEKLRKENITRD